MGILWSSYHQAASAGHTPVRKGGGAVDGFPLRIPEHRANALCFVVCICPKEVLKSFSRIFLKICYLFKKIPDFQMSKVPLSLKHSFFGKPEK